MSNGSFAETVLTDPGAITIEIFGKDSAKNRRRVYRLFDQPEDVRLPGLFKIDRRRNALHVEVFRTGVRLRAGGARVDTQKHAPTP
jgi:hypothetical protein